MSNWRYEVHQYVGRYRLEVEEDPVEEAAEEILPAERPQETVVVELK